MTRRKRSIKKRIGSIKMAIKDAIRMAITNILPNNMIITDNWRLSVILREREIDHHEGWTRLLYCKDIATGNKWFLLQA